MLTHLPSLFPPICTPLGSVSAGNLQEYLPFILSEIEANPRRQYLLLYSLKEVITCHYVTPEAIATLRPQVANIWWVCVGVWVYVRVCVFRGEGR